MKTKAEKDNFRRLLLESKASLNAVAMAGGVSKSTIRRAYEGERITLATKAKIAKGFSSLTGRSVSISEVFWDPGDNNTGPRRK